MLVELSNGRIINMHHIIMIRKSYDEEQQYSDYRMNITDFEGSIPITPEDREKIIKLCRLQYHYVN